MLSSTSFRNVVSALDPSGNYTPHPHPKDRLLVSISLGLVFSAKCCFFYLFFFFFNLGAADVHQLSEDKRKGKEYLQPQEQLQWDRGEALAVG